MVVLSLTFCFSPVGFAAHLYASFPGSGIWVYPNAPYSGNWQGNWQLSGGEGGALLARFYTSQTTIMGSVSLANYCGDASNEIPISGKVMTQGPIPVNNMWFSGSFICDDQTIELGFTSTVLSKNTISGNLGVYADDVFYDRGTFTLNNPAHPWLQITPNTPEDMNVNGSSLYALFGVGGIWMWQGVIWTMITPSTPENMVGNNWKPLFADFGAGGIWMWNGTSWTMLTPSNPENMVASGSTLYAEFGAGGIWKYDGSAWTMLTPSNPENMVADRNYLYADFGVGGLWMWNGTAWTMLTPSNPENMVVYSYSSTLFSDFGAGGLWMWNGTAWTMLSPSNPSVMAAND